MKQAIHKMLAISGYALLVVALMGLPGAAPAAALDRQSYKNLKLFNEVLDMVGFGANKTLFKIGMDFSSRLRRKRTFFESPSMNFLWTGGKKSA